MKKKSSHIFIILIISAIIITIFYLSTNKINLLKKQKKLENYKLRHLKSYKLSEDIASITFHFTYNDKLYINDYYSKSVFILSNEFKIIKSINKLGHGPGELLLPTFIYNDLRKEQLVVIDIEKYNEICFDYSGIYIEENPIGEFKMVQKMEKVDNGIVKLIFQTSFDDNKMLSRSIVDLMKKNQVITLAEYSQDPQDFLLHRCCSSNNKIFISPPVIDEYSVTVFNNEGDSLFNISKEYKKIKKSKMEIEYEKQRMRNMGNDDTNYRAQFFKPAIRQLLIYKNNLWVLSQTKKTAIFDIYRQSGQQLGRISLGKKVIGNFFVLGNYLYELISKKDGSYTIKKFVLNMENI